MAERIKGTLKLKLAGKPAAAKTEQKTGGRRTLSADEAKRLARENTECRFWMKGAGNGCVGIYRVEPHAKETGAEPIGLIGVFDRKKSHLAPFIEENKRRFEAEPPKR